MTKCFIIMPFKKSFEPFYLKLKSALAEMSLHVYRADEIYSNRPVINDIIDQIISSDIIVADVSGKNPNVNYELGIAHALKKDVIIISQKLTDVPFDYRHIRTIIYDINLEKKDNPFITHLQSTITSILSKDYRRFVMEGLEKFYKELTSQTHLGLQQIFSTRQALNIFLDSLWQTEIKRLDIIAFGLKSFRDFRTDAVREHLEKNLKVRILTLNPYSDFVRQREKDEKLAAGSIKETILRLHEWVLGLSSSYSNKNLIDIKFYNSLPLDFYWRQDDNVFIGPYLHGIDSQQTMTLHFARSSYMGSFYSNYFEKLWQDKDFASPTYPNAKDEADDY